MSSVSGAAPTRSLNALSSCFFVYGFRFKRCFARRQVAVFISDSVMVRL
ncbi:hypothetical protein HMPREF9554_01457 [Treponema phagedenis F0421]|nr:hypothetical protein HMPREF9554_01457 [Treponema phagedenis F0421]